MSTGVPDGTGGGCGCGCGSVLVGEFDVGGEYAYPDDIDLDGWEDTFDNCMFVPNIDQGDSDGDGIGDVCDTDDDNDGILDVDDACPLLAGETPGPGCTTDDDAE